MTTAFRDTNTAAGQGKHSPASLQGWGWKPCCQQAVITWAASCQLILPRWAGREALCVFKQNSEKGSWSSPLEEFNLPVVTPRSLCPLSLFYWEAAWKYGLQSPCNYPPSHPWREGRCRQGTEVGMGGCRERNGGFAMSYVDEQSWVAWKKWAVLWEKKTRTSLIHSLIL